MAKIGNLQVDTLNIAANAVSGSTSQTGSGNGTTQITVANPAGLPVQLFYYIDCSCTILTSSGWAEFTFTATRVRGSLELFSYTVERDSSGMVEVRNTVLDISAAASDVYRIEVLAQAHSPGGGNNFASVQKREIAAEYVRK